MPPRKDRVVFLNPWKRFMGPNRYLYELMRHSQDLRSRALIVFGPGSDAVDEYDHLGCATEIWPEAALLRTSPNPLNLLSMAWTHTVGLARLWRRLRRLRPTAVVTNTENLWIGGIASRLLGVPHAQVFHALGFQNRLGRSALLLRTYLWLIRSWNDLLIAVSQTVAISLENGGAPADRIRVQPNLIAVHELAEDPGELTEEVKALCRGTEPILLSVGHLSPMKGQDLLIEALPRVLEHHPNALLLLAGGSLAATGMDDTVGFERRLHGRSSELDLDRHIVFLGDTDQVPALLRRADVYVQPSRTESFGRVIAESLVIGTPVVAFDVGGIREVAGEAAILVEPGDTLALADRILEVLDSPEQASRRTLAGARRMTSDYDAGLLAPAFADLIDALTRREIGP